MKPTRAHASILAAASAVILLAGCTPAPVSSHANTPLSVETVHVIAVVDGDTIDVDQDGQPVRVRLIGIDTPEIGRGGEASECYAEEARAFLDELLYGQEVQLIGDATQGDVDRYGRLLRHVYVGEVDAAEAAIAAGAGYEYTYDTPYERQGMYRDAERVAVDAGAGVWGVCETGAAQAR